MAEVTLALPGGRRVKIRGALRDELVAVRADAGAIDPDGFVFATSTGRKPSRENVRNRPPGDAS